MFPRRFEHKGIAIAFSTLLLLGSTVVLSHCRDFDTLQPIECDAWPYYDPACSDLSDAGADDASDQSDSDAQDLDADSDADSTSNGLDGSAE